jgi:hypothetical protein
MIPGIKRGSWEASGGVIEGVVRVGDGDFWALASLRLWETRQESLQYLRGLVEESEHSVPQLRQFMFGI